MNAWQIVLLVIVVIVVVLALIASGGVAGADVRQARGAGPGAPQRGARAAGPGGEHPRRGRGEGGRSSAASGPSWSSGRPRPTARRPSWRPTPSGTRRARPSCRSGPASCAPHVADETPAVAGYGEGTMSNGHAGTRMSATRPRRGRAGRHARRRRRADSCSGVRRPHPARPPAGATTAAPVVRHTEPVDRPRGRRRTTPPAGHRGPAQRPGPSLKDRLTGRDDRLAAGHRQRR